MMNLDPGTRWRHIKTGGLYAIYGFCMLEAEWKEAVLYRAEGGGPLIARALDEFTDGRFEPVT